MRAGAFGLLVVLGFVLPYLSPTVAAAEQVPESGPQLYIVEFEDGIRPEWRGSLVATGADIIGYIPPGSYLIAVNPDDTSHLATAPGVRSVDPYHAEDKIGTGLRGEGGEVEVRVWVYSQHPRDVFDVALAVGRAAVVRSVSPERSTLYALADRARLLEIAASPQVLWIEPAGSPQNLMDHVREYTGAEYLYSEGFSGTGVVGQVFDSGIRRTHQEFADRLVVDGDPPVDYHGTAMFSIVFGRGASAAAEGMMPGTTPSPPTPTGVFTSYEEFGFDRLTAAERLQAYNGVFQSDSWSTGVSRYYTIYTQDSDRVVFEYDISLIQAMGNNNNPAQDAMAKDIIAVGAICHWQTDTLDDDFFHGNCENPTPLSARGPANDGRIKPDLVGPGDKIYAAGDLGDTHYLEAGDTSGATAVVAGAVGLVNQVYRENAFGNNPSHEYPRPATVKALLIANAHQYDLQTQAERCEQGWGTPDLAGMYQRRSGHFIVDEDIALQQGSLSRHEFMVQNVDEPLKITLAWTDVPAVPGNLRRPFYAEDLVNDLDLFVVDPQGHYYWGNSGLLGDTTQLGCPGASRWSRFGGTADRTNNVENVFVESPAWGTWTMFVRAHSVPLDGDPSTPGVFDQPYSLVASAGSPVTDEAAPSSPEPLLGYPSCGASSVWEDRPTLGWTSFTDIPPSSGLRFYELTVRAPTFPTYPVVFRAFPNTNYYQLPAFQETSYGLYWDLRARDNAGSSSEWWPPLCYLGISYPFPEVATPQGVSISKIGADGVRVSWDHNYNLDRYEVYESSTRTAFGPWAKLGETTGDFFDATGHQADGLVHHYVVRGFVDSSYQPSRSSRVASKVPLQIHHEEGRTNIHWFSLPYDSEYVTASDISDELTASKIDVVGKWDPGTQATIVWYYSGGMWHGTDFPIGPGDGLYVGSLTSFDWPVVGRDPPNTLSFTWRAPPNGNQYFVGLPYNSVYTSASEIVSDIEGSIWGGANTKITRVSKFYQDVQDAVYYYYSSSGWGGGGTPTSGWTGTDFLIEPGDIIVLTVSSTFDWAPRTLTAGTAM